MRNLTSHLVNPCNESLKIEVLDEPGSGGANHLYRVSGFVAERNASWEESNINPESLDILFQQGPIAENGTNGITQEVLLAIVIDRLRCFQAGPYACRENAIALTKIEEAQMWLQKRTRERMARNVEGTSAV